METEKRQILITSALPYANGDIHLGHMVEHFITDFWTRFQKMRGHECLSICADDTHGAPIMVAARKNKISPESLIATMHDRHTEDLRAFDVIYDSYHSSNSSINRELCDKIYLDLVDQGHIEKREIQQAYCKNDKMFLPDRFVKGTCPKCKKNEQYGDSCDACGSVYSPLEMIDPCCSLCGEKPEERSSEHHFCKLASFKDFLREWVPQHTSAGTAKKLKDWLDGDLQDWCLSRDEPYFGFEIPGAKGKYYYVWFDAPVCYIASTKAWCDAHGRELDDFWKNEKCEIYHNIGKDIIYFHTLFWPVMLKNSGFQTPTEVMVHGMLTINGEKLSKSKGTFINARTYLEHLDPSYLRYYFACKINSSAADLDLNWDDFTARVNADLVGKITNIASRGAQMLQKKLDGKMGKLSEQGYMLLKEAQLKADVIAGFYESRQFSKAILEIREIADSANKYFDDHEPWKLIKLDPSATKEVLTTILNLFRVIAIYLKPILPQYSDKAAELFGEESYMWNDYQKTLEDQGLKTFQHLLQRVDPKKIIAIVDQSKTEQTASEEPKQDQKPETAIAPLEKEITIESFLAVDLRVARVEKAEDVAKAKKLLKLTLDLGELGKRQIFAGIKSAYQASDLDGKLIVVVANLKPRQMKFGLSEGMLLAAGPGGQEVWILEAHENTKPGMRLG